jgi:hypothetical protein
MKASQIIAMLTVVMAGLAWLQFAENPTKKNLGVAMRRTLPFV